MTLMKESTLCCNLVLKKLPKRTSLHRFPIPTKRISLITLKESTACVLSINLKTKTPNKTSNSSSINFNNNSNTPKFKSICSKESKWTLTRKINNLLNYKDKIKS